MIDLLNIEILRAASLMLSCAQILRYDQSSKKLALVFGMCFMDFYAKSHHDISPTASYLYDVITVEFVVLALFFVAKIEKYLTFGCCIINALGFIYALSEGYHNQLLANNNCPYMLLIVSIGFLIVWILNEIGEKTKTSTFARRKIFHLIPILILPYLSRVDYQFYTLMLTGSFYLFLQLELCRYFNQYFTEFTINLKIVKWMLELNGSREKYFWFTHLFLIMGLSSTYFYYGRKPIADVSVILALGDAMAAAIGRNYGCCIIENRSKKTLEGFLAFFITVAAVQYAYLPELSLGSIGVSSAFCGLVEVYSGDLDNLLVPLSYIFINNLI